MPASGEFLEVLADDLVASGVGTGRYSTSGVSVQLNYRRDMGAPTVLLLQQAGGLGFSLKHKEQQGVQVLVDSIDPVSAQTVARQVFDQFHERTAERIPDTASGHLLLWMRATTLPQPIPVGPVGAQAERTQFSVNFEALLVKE